MILAADAGGHGVSALQVIISILSLIAAGASATAAWFAYRITAQTAREAIRPELEVSAWDFTENGDNAVVVVKAIKNLGKGPACNVQLAFRATEVTYPLIAELLPRIRRPACEIVYPGEEVGIDQTFSLVWDAKSFPDVSESRLYVWFWSRARDPYIIAYQLSWPRNVILGHGHQIIAPGLYLYRRMVYQPPSRLERLRRWLKEVVPKNPNPF